MRKNLTWFAAVVTAALLQSTWPEWLKLQEVMPDLCLILVVYFAIADGEERAMCTGLVGGLYQDVASNTVLGHHVLCLVLVGYAAGRLSTRLVTEHPAVKVGLVFMAGLFDGLCYAGINYIQKPANGFVYPVLTSVVPGAFYTALISPALFLLLNRIFGQKEPMQRGIA